MLSPRLCDQQLISRKIAELFKLKLILTNELVKGKNLDIGPAVLQELHKNTCSSWLLDGFPTTRTEAEQLWNEQKCHVVINLKLPLMLQVAEANKIIYMHENSGRTYSMEFNPPKRPGRDDVTGDELVRQEDLSEDEVRDEIMEYEEMKKPVLEFYRENKVLQEIHGNSTADLINKSRICLSSVLTDLV